MNYAFVYGSFAGADRVSRIRLRRYSTRFDFNSSSERARATNEYFPSLRRKIATIFRPGWRSMKISRGNFSCTGEKKKEKRKRKRKKFALELSTPRGEWNLGNGRCRNCRSTNEQDAEDQLSGSPRSPTTYTHA